MSASENAMSRSPADHGISLEIGYPDRERDWLTVFFRPFTVVPIAIVLVLVAGPGAEEHSVAAGGVVFFPTALMLLFRRKYPRWWFDWNLELTRFTTRVLAYLCLLRDEYPSTDEEQAIYLDIDYPDATELNRWLPLVKWLLAVPHYVVLAFLAIAAGFCVIIAWFAILITGSYPRGLFDFVVGVLRWWLRVAAYAFLLTTDRYPPFRLSS
jgi:Domain of unknown function (DUF4389)